MPGRRWLYPQARYTQGVEIFTTILRDSQTVLQAETNLVQATAAMSTDSVALSKALGGGWQATFPAGPTPPLDLSRVSIPPSDRHRVSYRVSEQNLCCRAVDVAQQNQVVPV